MLTKTQVKVILILLDKRGHAGWELAQYLEMNDSNLNPILKDLEQMGIISKGKSRLSKRQHKKKGDYREYPYYLSTNLDDFKSLIREVAKSSHPYDTGFVLAIIEKSKYIKIMKEKFKDDIKTIIKDELYNSDSPYSDPLFVNIIEPELEDELIARSVKVLSASEIQVWYKKYLCMRRGNKVSSTNK